MEQHTTSPATHRKLALVIGAVLLLYAGAALLEWPQAGTRLIVAAHVHAADLAHDDITAPDNIAVPAAHDAALIPPAWYTVVPFGLMLGAIAVLPLIPGTAHWWERNRNRLFVALGLSAVVLLYYLVHSQPVEQHWPAHALVEPGGGWFQPRMALTVLQNALLGEYVPFLVLLLSLFVICGGVRISGDLPAHPLTNTALLAVAGLLASFVGTTGAAMLLIRPLLETNRERRHVRHTVVFFIFIACNCGGCLLPIGDPPLFLGYLEGVHFFWTLQLWPEWLLINVSLLAIYWCWDHFFCYPRESPDSLRRDETEVRRLTVQGLALNGPLLLGVVLSVALLDPSKPVPGTDWHPWLFLREVVQLGLVGVSLCLGATRVRQANHFNYHAIVEVAVVFLGIFICMQPALQILAVHGGQLGIDTAHGFFWATGLMSAALDNAPTYLVFFKTAQVTHGHAPLVAGVNASILRAISCGSVFLGALTYIGNGPNFMVKSIAEQSGVRMPSFFGYLAYSCAVLLPLLALASWLFF